MEKTNQISIQALKLIVDSMFDHIRNDLKIESVTLDEDYYWEISQQELYSISETKPTPNLGSLYADLEFLLPLFENKEQAIPAMFIHVAPLLRYLSQRVKSY